MALQNAHGEVAVMEMLGYSSYTHCIAARCNVEVVQSRILFQTFISIVSLDILWETDYGISIWL